MRTASPRACRIAAAVEEQAATTAEIDRSLTGALTAVHRLASA